MIPLWYAIPRAIAQAGALRAAGRDPEALCPLTGSLSIADLYQRLPPGDALGSGEGQLITVYAGSASRRDPTEGHHRSPENIGIPFEEAATVFADPDGLEWDDPTTPSGSAG